MHSKKKPWFFPCFFIASTGIPFEKYMLKKEKAGKQFPKKKTLFLFFLFFLEIAIAVFRRK